MCRRRRQVRVKAQCDVFDIFISTNLLFVYIFMYAIQIWYSDTHVLIYAYTCVVYNGTFKIISGYVTHFV